MLRRRFITYVQVTAVFTALFLLFRSSSVTVVDKGKQSHNTAQASDPAIQVSDDDGHSEDQSIEDEEPREHIHWYTDAGWLHSFSTTDPAEDRVALPPALIRTPVYTYHESSSGNDIRVVEANGQLLQTWKRAWWARGFEPIVLSEVDALHHPLAEDIKSRTISSDLKMELLRWLAWTSKGAGVLSRWDCVPMSDPEDPLLLRLARGSFESLTVFEGLNTGLFAGEKIHIDSALDQVMKSLETSSSQDFIEFLSTMLSKTEQGSSIACYSPKVISAKYIKLSSLMEKDLAKGTMELNGLIKLHLQTVWQNSFAEGVHVLKPLPAHTSKLIEPGQRLAQLLTECPEAYLQSSCPPNRPKCSPCVGSKMPVSVVESFRNKSSIFAISTIPHPLTMISLNHRNTDFNVSHIRRKTDRDPWIRAVTRNFLGDGRNGPHRVAPLKEILASECLSKRGLWLTVEGFPADFIAPPAKDKVPTVEAHPEEIKVAPLPSKWLEDLDWHFGFPVPRSVISHGESYSPVPGLGLEIKGVPQNRKSSYDPPPPTYEEAQAEIKILELSRTTIDSDHKVTKNLRTVAEAWNLADSEIWRFARALRARSISERKQWQSKTTAGAHT